MRSSMVNRDFLKALVATATMIRSKIFKARWIRSRWPLVMGSNEPGYTAISGISYVMLLLGWFFHQIESHLGVAIAPHVEARAGRRTPPAGSPGGCAPPPPGPRAGAGSARPGRSRPPPPPRRRKGGPGRPGRSARPGRPVSSRPRPPAGARPWSGPAGPGSSRLRRSTFKASGWSSTKTAAAAPRLKASIPRAPVPANRSSTLAPGDRRPQDIEHRLPDLGGRGPGPALSPGPAGGP